jgi:hypothetical protein
MIDKGIIDKAMGHFALHDVSLPACFVRTKYGRGGDAVQYLTDEGAIVQR